MRHLAPQPPLERPLFTIFHYFFSYTSLLLLARHLEAHDHHGQPSVPPLAEGDGSLLLLVRSDVEVPRRAAPAPAAGEDLLPVGRVLEPFVERVTTCGY